jgi:TetR/AcrR family transcriptional repressor of nem operon
MARPRKFVEHEVLERTVETFWASGYEAVSIDELVTSTGLSRSSIYQAYGNKRGLFRAALDFYVTKRVGVMLGGLEAPGARAETALEFFAMLDEVQSNYPDRFGLGCLLTNSMAELGTVDEEIRLTGTDYVSRLNDAFFNAIRGSAMSDEVARIRASVLSNLALGAFVIARGTTKLDDKPNNEAIARAAMAGWH